MKRNALLISALAFFLISFPREGITQSDFWEKTNGPGNQNIYILAVNNNDALFIGNESGVFRSADNGDTWSSLWDGRAYHLAVNPTNNDLFASTSDAVLLLSTDNGDNWTQTGLDTTIHPLSVPALAFASSGDLLAGVFSNLGNPDDGLYRSSDYGNNWNRISTLKPDVFVVNTAGDIFAGTGGSGIFRSSDNGDNWTEINTGLTNPDVGALVINSAADIFAGTSSGIFRSIDNGDNWTKVYTNFSNPVNALAINSTDDIFAAMNGGPLMLHSADNGDNWSEVSSGLSGFVVETLTINHNDIIFCGNIDGVFRSLEPTTAVEEISGEIPSSFSLAQNYPNPFNPATTIKFTVSAQAHVTLYVYDILGREVATLVDEVRAPGVHQVNFAGHDLPNGIYFYRMQAGPFSQIKKLTLLK